MILVSILIMIKMILFLSGTLVEHDAFLVFLVTTGFSMIVVFLISLSNLKEKTKNILLSIVYSLISIVMLIDVVHYSYFGALPSVKMLTQAGQLTDVLDSVASLLTFRNLLFIIDIPFVIYYLFRGDRIKEINLCDKLKKKAPLGVLAVLSISLFVAINSGKVSSLKTQEPFFFHYVDIKNTLKGIDEYSGMDLDENLKNQKELVEDVLKRSEFKEGYLTGIAKDKNLIVLQVEALQNFVIGLEYENQEVTPNLNKLIKDKSSIYYDNYFQLLGRGNTSDAEFVTNNSLHPSMETPTYDRYADNTFYGLPWVLRDNGYSVWAFHGYKKDFWSRSKAYPNQGYERFISEEDFDFTDEDVIGLGISDELFFEQTIDYLKELDQIDDNPFYAFVVSLTSHNPFDMPKEYHVLDIKKEHEGTILGDYLQSIHYTDKYIGEFIEMLKEEGLYDDTVIAIYGDHFAIQNTSSDVEKVMNDFFGGKYYFDDIMNIPLIIHVPGEDINHTNSKIGSQLDFFPTILNILGYENEKGIVFGRDLNNYDGYNNIKPQTIMRKGSFIDEDVIFVMSRTEIFEQCRVYDRYTKEELDIEDYRHIYDNVIAEINLSNIILKNDLIKTYMENNGKLDIEDVEKTNFKQVEKITPSNAKNMEELEEEIEESVVKINLTRKKDEDIYINDLFKFEELANWNEDKEDVTILLSTTHDNLNEIYNRAKFLNPDSRKDYLVEINDFESHYFVTQYGYENLILNILDKDYTTDEILDFTKVHFLYGIILDQSLFEEDFIKELTLKGINVYTMDEDEIVLY